MKITLNDVTNIDALSVINDNFDKIEQEFQSKVLYRTNPSGEPNSISNDIDMNGNDLLNVGNVVSVNGRWATIDEVEDIRDQVEADAATVAADKATTLGYRNTAQTAATDAQTAYDNFDDRYLGAKSADPSVDNDGNTLLTGALYYRTGGTPIMRVYNGTTWQDVGSITTTTTNLIDATLYANQAEAEEGVNNTKVMTPLRVKNSIDNVTVSALGAGTNIDLQVGTVFTKTISGATTFTVSNVPPAPRFSFLILELNFSSSAVVTWWANVRWSSGLAPLFGVAGKSVLMFLTTDGGATWTGAVLAKEIS